MVKDPIKIENDLSRGDPHLLDAFASIHVLISCNHSHHAHSIHMVCYTLWTRNALANPPSSLGGLQVMKDAKEIDGPIIMGTQYQIPHARAINQSHVRIARRTGFIQEKRREGESCCARVYSFVRSFVSVNSDPSLCVAYLLASTAFIMV